MACERYRVFRNFPWYTVHAVIGTRVAGQALFKSLRRIPALRIAGALETAYRDGKYVEYMNTVPQKESSMSSSDIFPYTTFNCPHWGAHGDTVFGEARYTCLCRFKQKSDTIEPPPESTGEA